MPKFLTESRGPETLSKCWKNTFAFYSNATVDGTLLDQHDSASSPQNDYQRQIEAKYHDFFNSDKPFKIAEFYEARGLKLPGRKEAGSSIQSPRIMSTLKTQSMLFRPNANYRRSVMENVHKMRSEENFPLGTRCASIHIRRGDRVALGNGRDVKEMCSHYRRFTNNGSCVNIDNPNDHSDVVDYGCFSQNPYGTLTLVDYLERAEILLGNQSKTVFIMTDDAKWLKAEQAALSSTRFKDWTVHSVPAKYDKHSPGFDPAAVDHETESGIEFLTSLTLARQCQSFVGHFGSGFTVTIFFALCFQHEYHTGKCPSAYDIGYAYDTTDGHQLWMPPMNISP
jgi:hypothetical protein